MAQAKGWSKPGDQIPQPDSIITGKNLWRIVRREPEAPDFNAGNAAVLEDTVEPAAGAGGDRHQDAVLALGEAFDDRAFEEALTASLGDQLVADLAELVRQR